VILQTVRFLAVILTALALVPAGAHFFELPNKIGLSQEEYFTVQRTYRGWALYGFVLLGAIGADLVHAILIRDEPYAFWLALLAFLLMVSSLVIFFIWTYPANQATSNWTVAPANWVSLRTQWEFSHVSRRGVDRYKNPVIHGAASNFRSSGRLRRQPCPDQPAALARCASCAVRACDGRSAPAASA
jgi:hypothetical protein